MGRSAGRSGYRYRKAIERLRQPGAVCVLCGNEIDTELRFPDRLSWSLEHLDGNPDNNHPDNHASAHLTCNSTKGARDQWKKTTQPRPRTSRMW
ncbi:hypothetical protein SAMN04487905_10635 [Actinopolyspora xinjiangensis]|uniref:HNH endonuclease n=1 Tax=Actinopolyspora xinjiangensis TaxID=405564 RepID=A0A1H0U4N9_9ACTN|nr:hypothetical protein SAMN04487905_10635 [Actinopolyspora xinjiangensis]